MVLYWAIVIAGFACSLGFAIFLATQNTSIGWVWLGFGMCTNLFTTLGVVMLALLIQRAKDVSRREDWRDYVVHPMLAELGDVVRCIYKLSDVPWEKLFEQAGNREVDVVVQGWDKWESDVRAPLRSFLHREGKINLFVHHYDSQYLKELHEPWERRMNRTTQQAREEIIGTIDSISAAVQEASAGIPNLDPSKRLSIRLMTRLNWFCAIRFGPDRLLLSVYAHHHRNGVEAPFFLIRTDVHKEFGHWFEQELIQLRADSIAHAAPEGRQDATEKHSTGQ